MVKEVVSPLTPAQCEILRALASEPRSSISKLAADLVLPLSMEQVAKTLDALELLNLVQKDRHHIYRVTSLANTFLSIGCYAERQGFVCAGCMSPKDFHRTPDRPVDNFIPLIVIEPQPAYA